MSTKSDPNPRTPLAPRARPLSPAGRFGWLQKPEKTDTLGRRATQKAHAPRVVGAPLLQERPRWSSGCENLRNATIG